MKQFLNSAFFWCLMVILVFVGLALIADYYREGSGVVMLFIITALVFTIILPGCSTKR